MVKGNARVDRAELQLGMQCDIPVRITRIIDNDGQPTFVECVFEDFSRSLHVFHLKLPIVTEASFADEHDLPEMGHLRCTVVALTTDAEGRRLANIDTSRPFCEESIEDRTEFTVLADELVLPSSAPTRESPN